MKSTLVITIFNLLILQSFSARIKDLIPGIAFFNGYSNGKTTTTTTTDYTPIIFRRENLPIVGNVKNIVEVPDTVFKKLGESSSLNDLQKLLGIAIEETDPFYPFNDSGILVRSQQTDFYLTNPEQAHCEPELKVVDLGLVNTHEITYFPTCVRVKQCGGCCPQKHLLSCQPTASKKIVVKVLELTHMPETNEVVSRAPARNRRNKRVKVEYNSLNVTVEEHTNCECMCQVREEACDLSVHNYDGTKCECICKQKDEEEKCLLQRTHFWDKQTCKCLCRYVEDCSSGHAFNHNTCSCKPILSSEIVFEDFLRSARPKDPVVINRRKPVAVPLK